MASWWCCGLLLAVLFAVFKSSCSQKVSEVGCTNEGTECDGIMNSACDTTPEVLKCKCNPGYEEDSGDEKSCVKIIGSACTGTGPCPEDANSVCVNDKCACKEGHGEKNNVCTLTVSGTTCSGTGACTDIQDSACDGTHCSCIQGFVEEIDVCAKVIGSACTGTGPCPEDANSVCVNDKCACKEGHGEKNNVCTLNIGRECSESNPCPSNANLVCDDNSKCTCADDYGEKNDICTLTVNGTDCSATGNECDDIGNALCDDGTKRCKCGPNFVMNVDTCVPENTAASTGVGAMILVLSVFATSQGMLR